MIGVTRRTACAKIRCMRSAAHPTDNTLPWDASFAALLRDLRLRAGLTQEDLAARSGVSARTVSDLERGLRAAPQATSATLLADALTHDPEERAAFFACVSRAKRFGRPRHLRHPDQPVLPILGREREVAEIRASLAAGERLVVLVGPGGVGKTRLAWEIARRPGQQRELIWVRLDEVGHADGVLPAILRAAGVPTEDIADPMHRLVAVLEDRSVLLVLDNVEHVIEIAPQLAELARALPQMVMLVTSRETLRVSGERVVWVQPLPLPDENALVEDLEANPAVALFRRAAEVHVPAEAFLPQEAARIVRQVDGLPLAIELAAAQTASMPVATIAAMMDSVGISLLAQGRRDGIARFETVDRAIAWSVDLLPAHAQRLFLLLGAFHGGFTLELLGNVARHLGEPDLVKALPSLINSNLVVPGPGGDPRFRMLEPVRFAALAMLRRAPDREAVVRAHARVMLRFAEEQALAIAGRDPLPALDAVEREYVNIHRAIADACEMGESAHALRALCALHHFHDCRGHLSDARASFRLARTTAEGIDLPQRLLGESLFWAGYFAYRQGDVAECAELTRRLRIVADAEDDSVLAARADILTWLLKVITAPDEPIVDAPLVRALARLDDAAPPQMRWSLVQLIGAVHQETGANAEALPFLREALAIAESTGCVLEQFLPITRMGAALVDLGEVEQGTAMLAKSLVLAGRLGLEGMAILPLLGIARATALLVPVDERTGRWIGLALALGESQSVEIDGYWRGIIDHLCADLEERYGSRSGQWIEAGRTMTLTEAVALAPAAPAVLPREAAGERP